jgi:NAD(P)-dependent dehydrogenase (short-subunit alcohol dehydrogenase family)
LLKKYVVVTGVSSGIGYHIADELVKHHFHVFGSVRNENDGQRIKKDLGVEFTTLVFDVRDKKALQSAVDQVKSVIGNTGLRGLVNNAGIAVSGPLMHIPLKDVKHQFDVNVFGLLSVTQSFLPLLGAKKHVPFPPGRIINISSISGRIAFPFMGPYSASKYALEALSDALRRELKLYGIDVIVVEPSNIATPIWNKVPDLRVYEKTDYINVMSRITNLATDEERKDFLPVEMVSQQVRKILTIRKPKTRYIICRNKLFGWWLPRLLPDRWLDNIVENRLRLTSI